MTQTYRPAIDIEEDIRDVIAHYPPLQADRRHIDLEVKNGEVTLSGHVKSLNTRRYFLDQVPAISGVRDVKSDRLYTEESIRLESGRRIPQGVIANAVYGTVVLTGTLPDGKTAEDVVKEVAQIDGVERVVTKF